MENKSIRDVVNLLVKECFGKGFRGDWSDQIEGGSILYTGFPFLIAKRKWYSIPETLEFWDIAGRFQSNDGSKLVVRSDLEEAARKYARLYQERLGKEVKVSIYGKAA